MAKDYKNRGRAAAKRKPAPGTPAPAWFLAGLALGLGAAVAVHLYHVEFAPRMPAPVAASAPAPAKQTKTPPADDRLRFEFYRILPEMEVVVPEEEERALTARPPQQPPEIAEFASRTDTVLVIATSVSENVGDEKPKTVRWNLRLDVSDVDGKLMISRLETIR